MRRVRFSREQSTAHKRFLIEGPEWGLSVTATLHKPEFFQAQINECRHLAAHAKNHNDREFWVKMAQRWQGLLEGHSDAPVPERVEKVTFQRRRFAFAKRHRAA